MNFMITLFKSVLSLKHILFKNYLLPDFFDNNKFSAINHQNNYQTHKSLYVIQWFYRKNTTAMLLTIAHLLFQIQAISTPPPTTTCDSFPKIFGGSESDSFILQIDVFNDYQAIVGDTYDKTLTGSLISRRYPYIGLASIATSGKYYWAKALDQTQYVPFYGAQFSQDGALLIAHSGQANDNFIVVFEVSTGNIKSARNYQSSGIGQDNYNYPIKSMIVSSGPSPMAYVLSNHGSILTCSDQHLFKFDPISQSQTAVWIYNTQGCGHLGLVFGRNQTFIYAFSTFNGLGTVSLIDINGNAKWQYSTPDGNYNSTQIFYKAIDASTDMIIATSGKNFINYNRIISSTAAPYSVSPSGSQAYKDPNSNINLSTRGLYIIDKDNAKSLIFNSLEKWTDLATINFATLTIIYKRALPPISSGFLTTGVFVSDTVFYVGSFQKQFYRNITYFEDFNNTNNYIQGVVYTSNMSLTSCYIMSADAARSPVTMVTIPITSLANSIYYTISPVFSNFTGGYSSIDIIQSKITTISGCSHYSLSINQVTQSTSTFTFNVGVAEQTLAITPFSATVNCGTTDNTFKYSGFDNSTGLALTSYASDLITVDPITGSIKVAQAKPTGSYYVKVVGTLPDLSKTQYVFNITIQQSPPKFTTALTNVTVPLKSTFTYTFPAITDPDPGDTGTVSLVKDSASGLKPSFITLNTGSLSIAPTVMTDVNAYTMIVVLTDSKETVDYYFVLNVTNQAPVLTTQILTPVIATFGQNLNYTLPTSNDPEGLPYTTTLLSGPPYATLLSPTLLNIYPTNCSVDFGDRIVTIMLKDEEPKNLTYSFTIKVINLPPAFTGELPQDQTIALNSVLNYTLPLYSDPEGCPVNATFSLSTLSSFISISTNIIKFAPTQYADLGSTTVNVVLTDLFGIQQNTSFKVNVTNLAPIVTTTIPTEVIALFGKSIDYILPTSMDPEGLPYTTTLVSAPTYATLLSPTLLTIYPTNCSRDFGDQIVTIMLKDEEPKSFTYSFTIRVTNMPPAFTGTMPQNQNVALNSVSNYIIPPFSDPEDCPVNVTFYPSTLSSFVSISTNVIKFAPTQYVQVGSTTLTLVLTDLFGIQSNSSLIVNVTNQAPKVTSTTPTEVIALFGKSIDYILPTSMDPEGLPYTTTLVSGTPYVSLLPPTILKINPTNCSRDFGDEIVTIMLKDEEPKIVTYSFNISVGNAPPAFTGTLPQDQTVALNSVLNYKLPPFSDPEGCPVIVTLSPSSFVSISTNVIKFAPTLYSQVGSTAITLVLTDLFGIQSNTSFKVNVTNLAPKVTTTIPTEVVALFGKSIDYTLPTSIDPEGLPYDTIIQKGVSYVNLLSSSQIRIFPTNCTLDFGIRTITIRLEDGEPLNFTYSFNIKVDNLQPAFQASPLNQSILLNTTQSYFLPTITDPEGCPVTVSYTTMPLSTFLSINETKITFSPNDTSQLGKYDITVTLKDSQGLTTSSTLGFTVFQFPKFTSSVISKLELFAGVPVTYKLPVVPGVPDEYVVHTTALPSFVKFTFPDYTFTPNAIADLGPHSITGQLWNSYANISYCIILNVTNEAPYLIQTIPNKFIIAVDTLDTYYLSKVLDRENHTIKFLAREVKKSKLPPFVTLDLETSQKRFVFQPTKLDTQPLYQIQLDLMDPFGAFTSYYFNITIYNPPILTTKQQASNSSSSQSASQSAQNISLAILNQKKQNEVQMYKVTFEIVKVTRSQEAMLKLYCEENRKIAIQEIVLLFSNKTIEVAVVVSQKNTSYKIPTEIISKDLSSSQIRLRLKYPNLSNISISQVPDKLSIRVENRIQVLKKQIQTILVEEQKDNLDIPPQVAQVDETSVASVLQGGRVSFSKSTPANIFIGFWIQMIWNNLEDLSFLIVNSMISVQIPGIPSIIQAVMIKYIYFDILYTELWIGSFMKNIGLDFESIENDKAMSEQFSDDGFDSKQFLKNAGSSVIFVIMYAFTWILLIIISQLSRFWSKLIIVKQKLQSALMWNFSINFLLSQFSPLLLCSLINLYDLRFKGHDKASIVSAYFSIIILTALTVALSFLLAKMWRVTKNMNEKTISIFKNQFSKITESLKESKRSRLIFFWKPLSLIRWLVTLIILLALKSEPSAQIILLLALSVIQQCLILTAFPYDTKSANYISFYNEVATSAYLYLTFLLTDYLETQITANEAELAKMRLNLAWSMAILLIATIIINLIFALFNIQASFISYLRTRKICTRSKQKAQAMYQINEKKKLAQENIRSMSHYGDDVTKFEKDSFIEDFEGEDNVLPNNQEEVKKKKQQQSLIQVKSKQKVFEIKGHNEFYDMFEMRE